MRTKQYADGWKLVFVGTDSFRLAEYKIPQMQQVPGAYTIIIPKVHVQDIKKVAEYAESKKVDQMKIVFSDNMVSCQFAMEGLQVQCTALLIQGSFPDYENENIMPTTANATAVIGKLQLEKSLRKISILTRDLNNYALIKAQDNSLEVSSGETDLGQGETKLPAVIDGDMVGF